MRKSGTAAGVDGAAMPITHDVPVLVPLDCCTLTVIAPVVLLNAVIGPTMYSAAGEAESVMDTHCPTMKALLTWASVSDLLPVPMVTDDVLVAL